MHYSVKVDDLDLHFITELARERVLYNICFTGLPFKTVSGDVNAFHIKSRLD